MKLCKGFRDLLEICCEAFYYYFFFFFLAALGGGVLWEAREPVLFALCTTGVVCSWCKIGDTQQEQGVSLCLKMWYFHFSSF